MNEIERVLTVSDLIRENTLSSEMAALDWYLVENKTSMLVGGEVSTGKTTTLNYLSNFIKPDAKVVTIEYAPEPPEYDKIPPAFRVEVLSRPKLSLYHKNWITLCAPIYWDRPSSSRPNLLRNAIRQRPDYIVVDDLLGDEALILFQAMSIRYTGIATTHTSSVPVAFKQLCENPMNVPRTLIPNLGLIKIQGKKGIMDYWFYVNEKLKQFETEEERQQNLTRITKEAAERGFTKDEVSKRTVSTTEIIGLDNRTNEFLTNDLYFWYGKEDKYKFSGRSYLLERIAKGTGIPVEKVREQLGMRKVVLDWMVKSGIREYPKVVDVIQEFYSNPEGVFNKAKEASL